MRHLRCGRCGTGWRFNRLCCLWCDNSNQKDLAFLFDSDQPTWRIDVCNYCLGYIKTKITFDPLDADLLLVYDLETMSLDGMATNKGYKRPYKQPLASGD
jgi:FdhE protein